MRFSGITTFILAVVAVAFLVEVECQNPLAYHNVIYGWKQLSYKFPSNQTLNRVLKTGEFIPENNVITGVKVKGSRIFLTVPRWREGVPSSLNFVTFDPKRDDGEITSPPLQPYPSWEMNQLGNCKALQYVQSMEIDQFDRMWVIDIGRVNIFSPNKTSSPPTEDNNKCPPKLLLIDVESGEVLHTYDFPSDVVSPTGNFLNDIAVGCESKTKCVAYISDALEAKIIVYNFEENRSWFLHHSSMLAKEETKKIKILGTDYTFDVNIDGLTLSPFDRSFDRLYYCPLSGKDLFSVSTSTLKEAVNGITLKDSDVINHGSKSSQSDGIVMDSHGLLFYGLLASNGVSYFNTSSPENLPKNEVLFVQNDIDLQWPDTFGFDTNGYLYMVSNRLQRFRGNKYDTSEVNFRVSRVYTGHKSYMFSAKKSAEESSKQEIPQDVINATPKINLNEKTKYEYEHVSNHNPNDQDQDHSQHTKHQGQSPVSANDDKDEDSAPKNSSFPVNPYAGTLVFVLAVFVFHPAA